MERSETGDAATASARRPVREAVRFILLAYLGSWVVGGVGFIVLDLGEVGLGAGVLMVAVAALVLAGRDEGGIQTLARAIVRWRVSWRWYLVAIGVPIASVAIAVGVVTTLGGDGIGDEPAHWTTLLLLPLYVVLLGGPEEIGWRGYALPRLQTRFDALVSSLIIGVAWVGWHVPLFLFPGEMFDGIPFVPYAVVALASSVVYTWLYNSTRGSVLLAMILHGATNLSLAWVESTAVWYAMAGAWMTIAIGVVAVHGPTELAATARRRIPEADVTPPRGPAPVG